MSTDGILFTLSTDRTAFTRKEDDRPKPPVFVRKVEYKAAEQEYHFTYNNTVEGGAEIVPDTDEPVVICGKRTTALLGGEFSFEGDGFHLRWWNIMRPENGSTEIQDKALRLHSEGLEPVDIAAFASAKGEGELVFRAGKPTDPDICQRVGVHHGVSAIITLMKSLRS